MSYICGYNGTPKFIINRILDNSLITTLQFPMAGIKGIAPDNQRDMLIKKNYDGSTDVKDKGFICNWAIDYSVYFSAEDLYNLFKPFLGFAINSDLFRINFYPNSNPEDNENYDVLCINKSFPIKQIQEGIYTSGYEGLVIELQSRNRIKDFTSQWQLINPFAIPTIGIRDMKHIGIS